LCDRLNDLIARGQRCEHNWSAGMNDLPKGALPQSAASGQSALAPGAVLFGTESGQSCDGYRRPSSPPAKRINPSCLTPSSGGAHKTNKSGSAPLANTSCKCEQLLRAQAICWLGSGTIFAAIANLLRAPRLPSAWREPPLSRATRRSAQYEPLCRGSLRRRRRFVLPSCARNQR
jgi:hypothetical protein